MRLTAFTDYTLRTLICLAVRGQSTIAEIAGLYGVSEAHLTKWFISLDWRVTLKLSGPEWRHPAGEVPGKHQCWRRRATDRGYGSVPCFEGGFCLISPACVLRQALKEAAAAFLAVLNRYTLADLVSSPALIGILEKA